jgi:hypothetical protein
MDFLYDKKIGSTEKYFANLEVSPSSTRLSTELSTDIVGKTKILFRADELTQNIHK